MASNLDGNQGMKVFNVNVPIIYFEAFETLKLHYPSRSEIMRHALRDFLIKELGFDSVLTGEDRQDLIKKVQDASIKIKERNEMKKKPRPLGNSFYMNGGDDGK